MQILGINNYYQPKYLNQQKKTTNLQQLHTNPDSFTFKGIKVNGFQYMHDFKNIKNSENRAFFEQLKKKFREVPYFELYRWNSLPSYLIQDVYESCLDANDVVNKYAAQVLFNICHVSDAPPKELNIPEWNIKKEASKVYEEWGLDGVKTLLNDAKDKNGNHNINNLRFLLYLDKKCEMGSIPSDISEVVKKCADANGIVSDKTVERFKSVYQGNGGSSIIYKMEDKIKDLSDKGMKLIKLIQSGISRDHYHNSQSKALIEMCENLLELNTGKDKEKVYDIIQDNLDFIRKCAKKGNHDVVSDWSFDGTPIFKKALDKNEKLSAKNLEILFELKKNGEDELYEAADFLKDKKGIIRKENFEPYKKISEYIFDDESGFVYYKDLSNLNNYVKEFRNADGILNEEFIDKLVEMCEKYDIHSPDSTVRVLRSILSEINKNEKINWETVDALYKYAMQEMKNTDKFDDIEFIGNFVVSDFRDKATGKINLDKVNLLKLYPNKSISAIEKMIKTKNGFQSYIKELSDIRNLYTADDMLELLRDMNEDRVLKGVNLTIPIKDGDAPLLMYIADIMPTEENAKKYDKIIKILKGIKGVDYNYKDNMGVSFLEKVMMSENTKLLDLIKNKKIEYYPELEYAYENIQNPASKERVNTLNFQLGNYGKVIEKSEKIEEKIKSVEEEKPLLAIALKNTIGSKEAANKKSGKAPATLEDCHTIGDVIRHRRALTSYKDRWSK